MSNIPERLIGIDVGDVLEFRSLEDIQKENVRCGWNKRMNTLIDEKIVVTKEMMEKIDSCQATIHHMRNSQGLWSISLDMLKFVNYKISIENVQKEIEKREREIEKREREIEGLKQKKEKLEKEQEFSFEKFLSGQVGIVCETYEESVMLLAYFAGKGLRWFNGQIAMDKTQLKNWNIYKNYTCYKYGNGITYGNKENVTVQLSKFDLSIIK